MISKLATPELPTLDLRDEASYNDGHLPNAVNIPFTEINGLWHELPSKETPFHLCVEPEHHDLALEAITQRGFIVEKVFLSADLEKYDLSSGSNHNRLWEANPILENHPGLFTANGQKPKAIDIGCGSGRDSILMGLMGYDVIGIDVFDAALQRLEQSANRWQLNVTTVEMDCRKHPEELIDLVKKHQPQLIMQSRFLHRPLFDIYDQHLSQGSKIAIHTFLEGAAKFGKPKNPDFLLKNEELRERFDDWLILLDDVHYLDDGRPLSLFVAEKRL